MKKLIFGFVLVAMVLASGYGLFSRCECAARSGYYVSNYTCVEDINGCNCDCEYTRIPKMV